jgi:cytokinin dehydrogenase
MLSIQRSIKEHQLRLSQIPFLRRLETGEASIEHGRVFAADLTFWVMTFQDILRLNRSRVQQSTLREVAEQHLHEDSGHEKWFWQDVRALSVLHSAEWYFGEECARVRELSFELASEVFRAEHDEVRIALILTLEATGEEFFPRVVSYFERCASGHELKYFAQTHREVERDHEVFETNTHESLAKIELDAKRRAEALGLVTRVFGAFEDLGDFLEQRLRDKTGQQSESPIAKYLREASACGLTLRLGASAESFGTDFGGILRSPVAAVVEAHNESDVASALSMANVHAVELTIRCGGNSQAGQSIPSAGLSLHVAPIRSLRLDAGARLAFCGPGVTWRELLLLSSQHELVPYVHPLNLDLSIGGTVSAGGLGSNSHRHGTAAHHVAALRVVTGAGESVSGQREDSPDLFDAVLANQGRCGVATEIALRLRSAARSVQTIALRYDALSDLLHDMDRLSKHDVPDHMEAFCSSSILGMRRHNARYVPYRRWAFTLHLSYERDSELDPIQVTRALRANELVLNESSPLESYSARYDTRFQFMRASGAWEQAHPWLEWLLPAESAVELTTTVLERISPAFGDGHRLFYLPGGKDFPRFFAVPNARNFVGLAVLPTGVSKENLSAALAVASAVDRDLQERGAKRYLSGWLGTPNRAFWQRHYAEKLGPWLDAKKRWDPKAVLQSRLFQTADADGEASDAPSPETRF